MAKYKPCNYAQTMMLPVSLEKQLVPGSLEHIIHYVVEERIDLSVFESRYQNDKEGATAIHPKVLLKVILLAYARGLISSRKIEQACVENVVFIALACGYTPDHSTIARFVASLQKEIESVFCAVLLVCEELGLLGGTHFSLDGVRLSANVDKKWSGTFEELKRKQEKLEEKLKQVMAEHAAADRQPELELERQKVRERQLRGQIERLAEFLEKEKPKKDRDGNEIQSNVIDNESLKMPCAHGVIQGYNAQAVVDSKHQVIVAAEASGRADQQNLQPLLIQAKQNLVSIGKDKEYLAGKLLTADNGYHTLLGLQFCRDEKIDAYIPDRQFRQRDGRFARQERFKPKRERSREREARFSLADFTYEAERQVYRCPNGKELTCRARQQVKRYRSYAVYQARAEDCAVCPLRLRCLSKADARCRSLSVAVKEPAPNLMDEMRAKIDSAEGKKIYSQRMGIVEPVFANICFHKQMNRFTLRTKRKVDVQWKLFVIVHNIGKIQVFGRLN